VFVLKTEILQSKYHLVATQGLVFSVYDLSPCTVIRYSSLHTSQDRGVATALMIASFKGHSSVVRKLLQAQATVNATNEVQKVIVRRHSCFISVYLL